jgi:hypothetical protein
VPVDAQRWRGELEGTNATGLDDAALDAPSLSEFLSPPA